MPSVSFSRTVSVKKFCQFSTGGNGSSRSFTDDGSECGCEQMYGLMRIQIQISVLIQQQSSYIFIFGDLNFLLFADHIGATVIVSRNMTTMVIYGAQNNFK